MDGDHILLTDWTWIALDSLLRCPGRVVWVFHSRAAADRARRSYGRGGWRSMAIVRVV